MDDGSLYFLMGPKQKMQQLASLTSTLGSEFFTFLANRAFVFNEGFPNF